MGYQYKNKHGVYSPIRKWEKPTNESAVKVAIYCSLFGALAVTIGFYILAASINQTI